MKTSSRHSYPQDKGSVLMFAMMATVILAITLASFMSLSLSTMKNSDRSLHLHAAVNTAEAGVDEALWAINQYQLLGWTVTDPTAFSLGWDVTGSVFTSNSTAKRTATPFSHGASTSSFSSLINWGANTQRPTLAVRAQYNMPGATSVQKYIWCQLARRSLFAAGLVARNSITFSGNGVTVDSFRSALGDYSPDPSLTNRFDNGSVASASVSVASVAIQNADIYGRVATGGAMPTVGSNGRVGAFGAGTGLTPSRVSTDFQANLDPLGQPNEADIIAKSFAYPTAYQHITALPAAIANNITIGNPSGSPIQYYFLAGTIRLNGSEQIKVIGPVVLVFSGSLNASGGNTGINIDGTSSGVTSLFHSTGTGGYALNDSLKPPLTIFCAGDIDITGQGVLNECLPIDPSPPHHANPNYSPYAIAAAVQIYGTATTSQAISIKGRGTLCATVFAPNAAIRTVGNGETYGSIVGNTINYTGNGAFHYDESLDDLRCGKWAIEFWKELVTSNERSGAWEGRTYNF